MNIKPLFNLFTVSGLLVAQLIQASSSEAMDLSEWKKSVEEAQYNDTHSTGKALSLFRNVIANKPVNADAADLAAVYYRAGYLSFDDKPKAVELLKAAERYGEQIKKPNLQLVDIYSALGNRTQGIEACEYASKAAAMFKEINGEGIEYAIYLVPCAQAKFEVGEKKQAAQLIEKAVSISEHASLAERRNKETELFCKIGRFFETEKEFHSAEEYYKRAIYSGETLWYPLYKWTKFAIFRLASMMGENGRKAEEEKLWARLQNIEDTGKDPKGKDVCKFWNGENAPGGAPQVGVASRRNFPRPQLTREPRDIYQKTYQE